MIKCPKCGCEISEKADNCIYCGITRNTIDELILRNKLSNNKNKEKVDNKKLILLMEVMFLVLATITYVFLYIPKILDIVDSNKQEDMIKTCVEDYLGTWDYEKEICNANDNF